VLKPSFKSLRAAAQKGTTGARAALKHLGDGSEIKEAGTIHDLLTLVADSRAHVAILDREIAEQYVGNYNALEILRVSDLTVLLGAVDEQVSESNSAEFFDQYGIAVSSSQPGLLESINVALDLLRTGNKMQSLKAKYLENEQPAG